jgi:hypothetical protein
MIIAVEAQMKTSFGHQSTTTRLAQLPLATSQ